MLRFHPGLLVQACSTMRFTFTFIGDFPNKLVTTMTRKKKNAKESKEIRDLAQTLDDLRREIHTKFRMPTKNTRYCSHLCDDGKYVLEDVKEFRKEIWLVN